MKGTHLKYLLFPLLFLLGGGLFSSAHSIPSQKALFQGTEKGLGTVLHQKEDENFTELHPKAINKASSSRKEDEKEDREQLSFLFEQEDDDKIKHPFKLADPRDACGSLFTARADAPKQLLAVHPRKTSSQRWHLVLQILRE